MTRLLQYLRKVLRAALGLDQMEERVRGDLRKIRIELRREVRANLRMLRRGRRDTERALVLGAQALLARRDAAGPIQRFSDAEFRVFSQFGDDGIIQYLLHRLDIGSRRFVEFGVEDYREANTRFLLLKDDWSGLVMDASEEHVAAIRSEELYWRHDLRVVHAFIDRENIDAILTEHGMSGEIGLLSIDIDGMDYWVWEAIEAVEPVLVIVEYNSIFGHSSSITVPYEARFDRRKAHPSSLYFGASLAALARLGDRKGYALVGSNAAGVNAYFVRRDHLGEIAPLSASQAWVDSKVRESRGPEGELTFRGGGERIREIACMPVLDLEDGKLVEIGDLVAQGKIP